MQFVLATYSTMVKLADLDFANDKMTIRDRIGVVKKILELLDLTYEGNYGYESRLVAWMHRAIAAMEVLEGNTEATLEHLEQAAKYSIIYDTLPDRLTLDSTLLSGIECKDHFRNFDWTECTEFSEKLRQERYDIVRDTNRFKAIEKRIKPYVMVPGDRVAGSFTWVSSQVPEHLQVRQIYGIVFSNDGRILLRIEDGKYKLTGGKPEPGESFEETLQREYIEELNTQIEDIHYLGYLLVEEDHMRYAQVRMIARVKDIKENHIDPATGKMYGRKLVSSGKVKEYLNYADEAGGKMLDDAISQAQEIFGLDSGFTEEDNDLILVEPSADMKEEALEYKEEHFTFGDMQVHGSGGLAFYDDYDEWLTHIAAIKVPSPERPIQTSTFFSKRVSDGKLIGCIKLHHSLTDELKSGGNIAYGIRPSERGKGYGKKQLQLCLAYAKQLSLDHVIIACDKDNTASAATAKSCGAVPVNEFEEKGVIKQHYSIDP